METVRITIDGLEHAVARGTSVAAAILNAKPNAAFRRSVRGEARQPLCGMGTCFECRVSIDGIAQQRSCLLLVHEGMQIETADASETHATETADGAGSDPRASELREIDCDVLIVGAGPAGLAAAAEAARAEQRVVVLDDNPEIGGQIWRAERDAGPAARARRLLEGVEDRVEILRSTRVVLAESARCLVAERSVGPRDDPKQQSSRQTLRLRNRALILATGARERFVPFPGWTLPAVFGAGGLQALVKSGLDVRKRRIAVVGSGPLLLAVAAYLQRHDADIVLLAEQARFGAAAKLATKLWRSPRKLSQLLDLERALLGVGRRVWSTWPTRVVAENGRVRALELISAKGKASSVECDFVACAFGLVPDTRLARLLGCRCEGERVAVDGGQRTSLPGVWAAGELTGVGGVDLAIAEAKVAAREASGILPAEARNLRDRERRFADALDAAFVLRPELRELASDETIVCRCEDVPWRLLRSCPTMRDAKLKTRCGMGACQGRVCGPALDWMRGFEADRVRPPLFPTSVATMLACNAEAE